MSRHIIKDPQLLQLYSVMLLAGSIITIWCHCRFKREMRSTPL